MPYNKGDAYEDEICNICKHRKITPREFKRGGAGNGPDVIFYHRGNIYNLEAKNGLSADYGQRMLTWRNGTWSWSTADELIELYDGLNVRDEIDANFIPNKYTIEHNARTFTLQHKRLDQRAFENNIEIDINKLFTYYAAKNCFYMQVQGFGFYHLLEDVANIGTPQFDAELKLRFRAKTIHSYPDWNYNFYAVIKVSSKPTVSIFDIEALRGRIFPPIQP